MMNLCQCLQNNVVNSKLTCLIYSSLEALLNINVIATLEDNFGNSYELEFDFNNRNVKEDGVISVVPIGNFKPLTR